MKTLILFLSLTVCAICALLFESTNATVIQRNNVLFERINIPVTKDNRSSRENNQRLSVAEVEKQDIQVNFETIDFDTAQVLSFTLLDGVSYQATRKENEGFLRFGENEFSWRGTLLHDYDVILTIKAHALSGVIYSPTGVYEILPQPDQAHVLIRIDQTKFPPCAGTIEPTYPLTGDRVVLDPVNDSDAAAQDDGSSLDVLVAYTTPVRSTLGGTTQTESFIQQAISTTNAAYANSGITPRLRLVRTMEVDYDESAATLSAALSWLRSNSTVATARDASRADLVAIVIENGSDGCGLGYVMRNVGASFSDSAFSAVVRSCAVGNLSFAHEIGHNQGCEHNPENSDAATPSFPYSFGHYVDGSFRTVMSYVNPCSVGCTRVPYFSNPAVRYAGSETGIVDQRDNHRTINNTALTVSQFRDSGNNVYVTSSLTVNGDSCVGGNLNARFTVTNRGNTPITLRQLTAGGRLNSDNSCSGGCPDFPFANNITLNPGQSYNYSGNQTITRTGSYGFFVAYQRMDGSWVTNVPTDAGVGNTASANVTGTCGAANPMVSSSLTVSGQSCVNGVLTAQFTITNRGNAAITLQRLTAGGRLNGDNTGAGGFPDFPFANNITLNPGQSYNYSGNQTITRTGSYGFFVAYQRMDGSWVTNVPTDAGVGNTASANVTGTCGAANPMVSSSLTVSGQSCVGGVLTANFTITNRGNAAITLQRLTAGGRLNGDNTGAGGFPDFPFANNITLNPGQSYNYSGNQTITRTGSYGFFVAYQRMDGSWVTNVPTDAGVGNTASANVTGACGAANPRVSSSLVLSPAGPYFVGNTLTARFTITNRGTASVTFNYLLAGGRLNGDQTCSGGCPDFSPATGVTLNPGASYSYTGTQNMSRAGNYSFFVAYHTNNSGWVTNVPTDSGVTNTANITVNAATSTIAWEFSTFGNAEGWTAVNMSATAVTGGSFMLDPSGADPYIVSPNLSAAASTYQYFIVRMASNGLDSTGAVYFKTQSENFFSEDKKVTFTVSNCSLCGNAGTVRYAVFMAGNSKWTGTITAVRLDPTGSGQAGTNTDSIGIEYIRVSSSSLALNTNRPDSWADRLFAGVRPYSLDFLL